MRAVFLFVLACGCNAIDGADQYKKSGDDSSTCQPSCIATSSNCLGACASTRDACKAAMGCNPGCQNKCDKTYGDCTNACVSACTTCGCSQADCENAMPMDGGAGG